MAPKPKAKAIDAEKYMKGGMSNIYRQLVPFSNPQQILDANVWRAVARGQPVISDCISTLRMYILGLPWEIRAKDGSKQDELQDKIEEHREILKNANNGAGFDIYLECLVDDFEMLPAGAVTYTLRYSDYRLYSIKTLDGGTIFPFNDPKFPVFQYVPEVIKDKVFFTDKEIVRLYQAPRTELLRYGWGMAPPEKIYLAIEMLNRGDRYYAQMLLDTPEAGLLDLGDMSAESAKAWLAEFKNLFTGIDAFKIPVLYEHTVPAKYLPFARPPMEMTFNETTFKYTQLACASFGMTPGDIGMKAPNGSLSSDIRDERHTKATGKAYLRKKIEIHINRFLPDDLIFTFIDTDDELLVSKGRARSANAVAGRNLIESGAITPKEWRQQLLADRLITIPLPEEPNEEEFQIVKEINGLNDQKQIAEDQLELQKKQIQMAPKLAGTGGRKGGQAGTSLNKKRNVRGGKLESVQGKEPKPASGGGQGEIKSVVEELEGLDSVLVKEFSYIKNRTNDTRVRRLVKAAINKTDFLLRSVDVDSYSVWKTNYQKELFDQESDFEDKELIQKSIKDLVASLDDFYSKDKWWEISLGEDTLETLNRSYSEGLYSAAKQIQDLLYEEGYIDKLEDFDENDFIVKSSEILDHIASEVENLNVVLNSGTKYIITRMVVGAITDVYDQYKGLENVDEIIKSDLFVESVGNIFVDNLFSFLDERSKLVSDMEVNRVYNQGILRQYKEVGITKKYVVHLAMDEPCEQCKSNINVGEVDLDYMYQNKFGGESITPKFHTDCHCELAFSKDQLQFVNNNYFKG